MIARLQRNGFFVGGNRVVILAAGRVGVSQIAPRLSIVGLNGQKLETGGDQFGVFALFLVGLAEARQRERIARVLA